jgi:glycerol-3-phosphate acyltransferase PlsY
MLWGILWVVISYLLGSIPFAFIIGKLRGVDLREVGTRNIGGSNLWHSVGKLEGTIAAILDIGKGALAVWLAQKFGFPNPIQAASAVAVVAGHDWPIFLGFQGGRGMGPALGAMLLLVPKAMLLSLIFYALGFFTRALGLGVGVGVLALPFFAWLKGYPLSHIVASAIMFIFMVVRRLTGIGVLEEIKASPQKGKLIAYRVLFDNDYGWRRPR